MGIAAKQINYFLEARVGLSGFTSAGGTSDSITTALGTVLSTAARGGGGVPVQVGSSTTEGINTATGFNLTPVYNGSNVRLTDSNGNDVYGVLSYTGSDWRVSYFSAPGGTQTPYTMLAGTSLGFEVPYIFSLADLPLTALTATTDRRIAPDPATVGTRTQVDQLTVTAANTLSALTKTPTGAFILLVNGVSYPAAGGAPAVSYSGTTVTWSPGNAGFALATTDYVQAVYSY